MAVILSPLNGIFCVVTLEDAYLRCSISLLEYVVVDPVGLPVVIAPNTI